MTRGTDFEAEVITYRDGAHRVRHVEGAYRVRGELRGTFQCSGGLWLISLGPTLRDGGCVVTEYDLPYSPARTNLAPGDLLIRLSRVRESKHVTKR